MSRGKGRVGAWRRDPRLRAAVEQGVDAVLVESIKELPELDDPEEAARRLAKLRERLEQQREKVGLRRKQGRDNGRRNGSRQDRIKRLRVMLVPWLTQTGNEYDSDEALEKARQILAAEGYNSPDAGGRRHRLVAEVAEALTPD